MIPNKFKVGDKVKVIKDMPTVEGMLHKGEVVKIDAMVFPDNDMRVLDSMGRIWYVDFCDVALID